MILSGFRTVLFRQSRFGEMLDEIYIISMYLFCLKDKVEEVKNDRYAQDEEKGKVTKNSEN